MISPAFFDWGRPKIVQSPTTKFVHYLQGENDIDQLCCVLRVLGTPSESVWPVRNIRNNLLTVVSTRVESFPLGSYNTFYLVLKPYPVNSIRCPAFLPANYSMIKPCYTGFAT